MIGITSYGAYIPRLRLDRMAIFQNMGWFAPAIVMVAQGERSMCNWDEDAVTMAVAAARHRGAEQVVAVDAVHERLELARAFGARALDYRSESPLEVLGELTGRRGAEGMRVLAADPPLFFSFTWSGPPSIPSIRRQRLWVEIRLESVPGGGCRLTLINGGYGDGPDWAEAQGYFRRAWGEIVLPRLEKSLIDIHPRELKGMV